MAAKIGTHYRHYKNGHEYVVLAIAHHTETGEKMVVYQGLYDTEDLGPEPVFVRPQAMFEESIEYEGKMVERFRALP